MSYEARGRLLVKFDTQQVTEKFRKREFVLEMPNGNYTEQIKFQLTQDKCALLDDVKTGDELKVMFVLRGRPYTKNGETSYFTNIEAWRIDKASSDVAQIDPSIDDFAQDGPFMAGDGNDDGLPF
jgi:DNA replicative helicase MCM subunit Mcm2 (Cdc46/Mcm family)